jgi:pimeloyl-ACP methyl ester carboxylesterase
LAGLAGPLAAGGVAAAGAWLTRRTFIQHLADLWCFCRDFAVGNRPDMEARCDRFAGHVLDAVRRDDVDETLLIGHSYGAMMIVEAAARALERDENAFRTGAPVTLITLGSCIDTSTLHPQATARKQAVRRVAESTSLLWAEIQGRQDMINFYQDDPAVAAGLLEDEDRPNPVVRTLSLAEVFDPKNYNRFRFNYFRVHYQTICANDVSHPWDYMLAVAGPDPIADRLEFGHWELRWLDAERYARAQVPLLSAFSDWEGAPSTEEED